MIEYRIMDISDYEQVYKLWLSCAGMGLNNLDDSKEGIQRFLNRNPDTCFVAQDDHKIVGVIIAGSDGRRGYIYHTAVDPEHCHKACKQSYGGIEIIGHQQDGSGRIFKEYSRKCFLGEKRFYLTAGSDIQEQDDHRNGQDRHLT